MTEKEPIEIDETFDLAFRFVTETSETIFLTGKAGTGKTTFLRYLMANCYKDIIITAPTGVAAINAGGVTLHSLFHLPFHPFIPTPVNKNDLLQKLRFSSRRLQLLRKMELLVIDEVSMVRCDTMDAIDFILRYVRRKEDLPFGGVQVLFIGDLYQLPPVARREDWLVLQDYYNSEFFFDSQVIRDDLPVLIELKKIFRQKEGSFISLLNKVRNNIMEEEDFRELYKRYIPGFIPPANDNYITLTSHNYQADKINNSELERLLAEEFTYQAEIHNDFPETMFPAEENLILKKGAQVMFLKNDIEKRFFNGKIGIIKYIDAEEIIVESEEIEINVQRETWENTRYVVNPEDGRLQQEVLGTFTQFPLRLAWAITIHKSQGLTFDKVMIDAGAAFSSGQVYVALSRCTSLEGIVLLSKVPPRSILCNESVVKTQQSMSPRGSLAERFAGARQVFFRQLLDEIFSFEELDSAFNLLQAAIDRYKDKLSDESGPWILKLQEEFLSLREIASRFLSHAIELLKEEPVIEKNKKLQQRITDAGNHFYPGFIRLKEAVLSHPVTTEHREVSGVVNDYLNRVFQQISLQIYLIEYCRQSFTIQGFLKHKINFPTPKTTLNIYGNGKRQSVSDEFPNADLYVKLRRWRDVICETSDLPIYMVANSKSLREIAHYLPFTIKDLMQIKGFGKAKAAKYGDDILNLVKDYCSQNGLQSNMETDVKAIKKVKKKKSSVQTTPSYLSSYNLYRQGKTIAEIAQERNMVINTIEGHLARCLTEGLFEINELISAENQERINKAARELGWESLKALKDNLPDDISYGQLRIARAASKENSLKQ